MENILRVLVVDDSAYVRKVVKQMLSRSPFVEVVGTAKDGEEALEMVERLKPDVVTLDLIMPNVDGLEFLRTQMARRPVPVVVVSIAHEGGEQALAALDAGAVDCLQKPTALATEKIFDIADELISKVKAASKVPLNRIKPMDDRAIAPPVPLVSKSRQDIRVDLVAIGISTGGPQALSYLIPSLSADFPVPVAIVLHMPVGYTELYARRLNQLSQLEVLEAKEGQEVRSGLVLLAPAGQHMTFVRLSGGKVVTHLSARPFDTLHRPAADVMFQSAAQVWGDKVLGVVMTGMGSDGKQGAAWIKSQGGMILTEAESSCIVYGMPRSVVEAGLSDKVVPLDQMAAAIINLL
ncbi:chemotaxis-specific protein-glutamate methyltransferase CheB [[Phormidium] sp. ETS-05]|uniref:chemotaxis-specific protein-glutamate methyltransferase CheB n=1 Tax=[Phormidium] sp. ETS-05 TaxID=222819 RepID=UPI0018EF3286|nr:chemotaxis-specific protein-glutamate methyltransferase CheB [[Phormidium] sp. ETS-05]